MMRLFRWIWDRGILSTFMAGLFVILPVVVTLAIMGWVGSKLVGLVGPQSFIGGKLLDLGLKFVTDPAVAAVVGWLLVLAAIWALGAFLKTTARYKVEETFHEIVEGIPIVSAVYKPISQVVSMLKNREEKEMSGMTVVFCSFGERRGGGFLGLLASRDTFRMRGEECRLVYIPTSPLPMSGGLVFVPAGAVEKVDMAVDDVMKVYLSLGVLASQLVPERYRV